jgi:hypothetical protein
MLIVLIAILWSLRVTGGDSDNSQPTKGGGAMTEYEGLPEGAVRLSEEDRVRMERLYEEVSARVMEMGLIVGRALGRDTRDALEIAFSRSLKERNGGTTVPPDPEPSGRMIHFSNCEWGCYDYESGVCEPC